MRPLLFATLGAIIAGIYVIAYDTASGAGTLEGGQKIAQDAVGTIMVGGAVLGFVVGVIAIAGSASSKAARDLRQPPPQS